MTEGDKLVHCEKRRPQMPFHWTVLGSGRGKQLAGGTKQHVKLVFLRRPAFFLSSLSRTGRDEVGRWGADCCFLPLRISSPVKVEGMAGSCLFAKSQVAVLTCSEVPRPLVFFSPLGRRYLFTSSTTCSNISPSLSVSHSVCAWAAFHSSLCRSAACLWRTSFHCIRNWYLNAREASVRSGMYLWRHGWLWVSCRGSLPAVTPLNGAVG